MTPKARIWRSLEDLWRYDAPVVLKDILIGALLAAAVIVVYAWLAG